MFTTTTMKCLIRSTLLLVTNETLVHNSFCVFVSQHGMLSKIPSYRIIGLRTFDTFASAFKYADVRVHGTFTSQLVLCKVPRAKTN